MIDAASLKSYLRLVTTGNLVRRGERALMHGRRFGKTNLALSAINLGRMQDALGRDAPGGDLPRRSMERCRDVVLAPFEAGVK
jgi:hypothetical protein